MTKERRTRLIHRISSFNVLKPIPPHNSKIDYSKVMVDGERNGGAGF